MSTYHKWAVRYVIASLLCAVFAAVYEALSHGVWSWWMGLAWLWPLVLGALPFGLLARCGRRAEGGGVAYHAGVITLTAGSVMQGVFEIYGTTSEWLTCYWIAGGLLAGIGALAAAVRNRPLHK